MPSDMSRLVSTICKTFYLELRKGHSWLEALYPMKQDLLLYSRPQRMMTLLSESLMAMACGAIFFGVQTDRVDSYLTVSLLTSLFMLPVGFCFPRMWRYIAGITSRTQLAKAERIKAARLAMRKQKRLMQVRSMPTLLRSAALSGSMGVSRSTSKVVPLQPGSDGANSDLLFSTAHHRSPSPPATPTGFGSKHGSSAALLSSAASRRDISFTVVNDDSASDGGSVPNAAGRSESKGSPSPLATPGHNDPPEIAYIVPVDEKCEIDAEVDEVLELPDTPPQQGAVAATPPPQVGRSPQAHRWGMLRQVVAQEHSMPPPPTRTAIKDNARTAVFAVRRLFSLGIVPVAVSFVIGLLSVCAGVFQFIATDFGQLLGQLLAGSGVIVMSMSLVAFMLLWLNRFPLATILGTLATTVSIICSGFVLYNTGNESPWAVDVFSKEWGIRFEDERETMRARLAATQDEYQCCGFETAVDRTVASDFCSPEELERLHRVGQGQIKLPDGCQEAVVTFGHSAACLWILLPTGIAVLSGIAMIVQAWWAALTGTVPFADEDVSHVIAPEGSAERERQQRAVNMIVAVMRGSRMRELVERLQELREWERSQSKLVLAQRAGYAFCWIFNGLTMFFIC